MIASAIDLFLAYRFLKNLVTPFEKWQAYDTGVIDKEGNIIVPKKDRTSEQRNSFGYFDLIGMNLKKLLGKLPGGKSSIASYAAALLLIKEYNKKEVKESYSEYIDMDWLQKEFDVCLEEVQQMFDEEGVPVNNVSGGNIAAVGVGSKGEPPMKRSKVIKRFKEYTGVK